MCLRAACVISRSISDGVSLGASSISIRGKELTRIPFTVVTSAG
jgi:hypothetical protein